MEHPQPLRRTEGSSHGAAKPDKAKMKFEQLQSSLTVPFMLSSSGISLSARGSGENGRLGHGNNANCSTPKEVGASYTGVGFRVAAVSSGASHTLVVTLEGGVMAFGSGSSGK